MSVRIYPDVPRAYVDLDGVLFNYLKKAQELGIPEKFLKSVPGVYETLEPVPMAREAVLVLKEIGFDVWGLTKPPKENPSAATDKVRSIYRYFPEIGEQLIITPDKGCVGTARDILIDDHPEWANANNFPGKIFLFKGDWLATLKEIRLFHEGPAPK